MSKKKYKVPKKYIRIIPRNHSSLNNTQSKHGKYRTYNILLEIYMPGFKYVLCLNKNLSSKPKLLISERHYFSSPSRSGPGYSDIVDLSGIL